MNIISQSLVKKNAEIEQYFVFSPFHLNTVDRCLYRDTERIFLRAKTFAVLQYLVEHPGRLVTTTELLDNVWSGIRVSPVVVRVCIRELRRALADDQKAPKYIETVQGRGYRFIGPVTETQGPGHWSGTLVGREAELAQLHEWLEKALRGERQIVFVTGEAGIGKTTLIEAFLERIAAADKLQIGRGQCIDQYGGGEAYMPVLEALGRLGREPGGQRLTAFLTCYAPTWLGQLPQLANEAEQEALQRKVLGATKERMLREMAEAVEALTAKHPLVLVLEDLHWSDYSTLDLLASLAQHKERARLLVIGTFRPVEVLGNGHRLEAMQQELHTHGQCEELVLAGLTVEAVQTYLTTRFSESALPAALARELYEWTEGNPLFLVSVVNELASQGGLSSLNGQHDFKAVISNMGVPHSLQPLIEKQLSRLTPDEQHLLEVASVAGMEFSAATVAAALETDAPQIERLCGALVRRALFLQPNGTHTGSEQRQATRYRFLHALYLSVLYERLATAQRRQLHQCIGEWKETVYGERAHEIAAELAVHFEWGQDYPRAVQYLAQASHNSLQRNAHQEAIAHLTTGLELLKYLPDTPERIQQELSLQTALSVSLVSTMGYASSKVEETLMRAQTLCQQLGDTHQHCRVLAELCDLSLVQAEFRTAYERGTQLLRLAQKLQEPEFLLFAHLALGGVMHYWGECTAAQTHHTCGVALYEQHRQTLTVSGAVHEPGVFCLGGLSVALWYSGFPDQALTKAGETLALARTFAHPHNLALALSFIVEVSLLHRQGQAAQELAEELIDLATKQGFLFWGAEGLLFRGGALIEQGRGQEAIESLQQGLADLEATGARIDRPHFLALLAEAYGKEGQIEEGLATLTKAFDIVHSTDEHLYEPELYRIKGELLLTQEAKSQRPKVKSSSSFTTHCSVEAEGCFRKALDIAHQQKAKSLELRAVMSLSRLWQQQGKKEEAKKLLAEMYGWFTEGFDTKDLTEAKALKALLETLA